MICDIATVIFVVMTPPSPPYTIIAVNRLYPTAPDDFHRGPFIFMISVALAHRDLVPRRAMAMLMASRNTGGYVQQSRMKGSIDLDKALCHLELLPRPVDKIDVWQHGSSGSSFGVRGEALSDDDDEGQGHRVKITRKADGSSMVLCFSGSTSLQDWMKSIFDIQQRKATFSPLKHTRDGDGHLADQGDDDDSDEWEDVGLPGSPRAPVGSRRSVRREARARRRSADGATDRDVTHLGPLSSGTRVGVGIAAQRRRRRRRRGRRRGSLDSPSNMSFSSPSTTSSRSRGGMVPSSWADGSRDGVPEGDENIRLPPPPSSIGSSSTAAVFLGKASERLAGLPRGGRAAGSPEGSGANSAGSSSCLDEYGAFTTAHASIYEGWTRGLQPHGWGRMVFANGDCVEGWWEYDILEGSGEQTSREEGWTYRGGYVAGERHGPGRLVTAEGDAWECEWRHGVVASAVSGTHATGTGELYQGGCAPSKDDPGVPCRAGHGRLRRRNGEQVETQFRAGRAVDGAKGVVRFRNGAIFFGELREARPEG